MTPSYLADLEPTARELTPPALREGSAPRRARSYAPELTACATCGGPLDGPSYGGDCSGCAAASGDQDALADRLLDATRPPDLERDEALRLVGIAQDRQRPLADRVAALGALELRAPWARTRLSAGDALERLRRNGNIPSCFRPNGELPEHLAAPERVAELSLPPLEPGQRCELGPACENPAVRRRPTAEFPEGIPACPSCYATAERCVSPPDPSASYRRPVSPVWTCPRCGGPTRSADAPSCADGHPRVTMVLVEPGRPGGRS